MLEAATTSVWRLDAAEAALPPLASDQSADICVVGAGISGLTTAYLLARDGASVCVVEAGRLAGGESGRTTAHLVNVLDRGFAEIERRRGGDSLRLAIESHGKAIDEIEAIIEREDLDCDFRRLDAFLVASGDPSALDEDLAAANRAGFPGVEDLADFAFDGLHGRALRFPRQAAFHPLRYLDGLRLAIERAGGRIFGGTRVRAIQEAGGRLAVETAGSAKVSAENVVVATNSPIHGAIGIHTKQAAYRTYVVGARIGSHRFPDALVWDTADPFHYVRIARAAGVEYLIVGGEDHKTGQEEHTSERFARLERWASARWPSLRWEIRWSGQVMETVDGLGLIGRDPSHAKLWIATGDSGNGLTHGTLAAMIIRDGVRGTPNPWAELYDPGRFPLRATPRWASENLNVAAQLPRYLAPGEEPEAGPAHGRGAVVRRGLRPLAVYRDEEGVLHERSAVCPHLGCVVAWNEVESSWDCPCHGSRFDALGHVITGPAARDLAPLIDDDTTEPQPIPVAAPKAASS